MQIKDATLTELTEYVSAQLNHFFPDKKRVLAGGLASYMDEGLHRVIRCVSAVRAWEEDCFDYLHSSQYCIFLWYLANTIWRNSQNENLCTKLFYLNKALNGFECFYDNNLPERFFIGHTCGIVLVRNIYPEYLVLYQGVTVGKSGDATPELSEGVVLYPNSQVIGDCRVGKGSVLTPGTRALNQDIPSGQYVFRGAQGLVFRPVKRDIASEIFRGI